MRAPRGAGGVAAYGGKIYYAGGISSGTATPRFDVYDPVANTWTQLDPMPRSREHFQAVVADGKLWAIGGRNLGINNTIAQTDAYDFATGRWETGFAPIPTQRGGYAAGVVGGDIVVMGGERGGIARPEVQVYDPSSDSWRSLGPMPVARHGVQAAECNGGLYLAGGGTDQGGGHATTYHDVFFAGSATACGGGGSAS
jgi:N-acetylneuraminic acid mutarotase